MQFEYDDSQNMVFNDIAFWLTIVAVAVGLQGILQTVNGFQAGIETLITGAANVSVAFFLFSARGAMKRIVSTEGSDIDHTMVALKSLRVYFMVQAIAILLVVVGLLLGISQLI